MGFALGEIPQPAGTVVKCLSQGFVGFAVKQRAVLYAGCAVVVYDIPTAKRQRSVGIPCRLGGVKLSEVVSGVKLTREYEHICLKAARDFVSRHFNRLRVIAGRCAYT